jgi:hypothetical protein
LPFLASVGFGSQIGNIFRQRLNLIEMEASRSSDGSFFGDRFTQGRYYGQYAKYETDCFACIALALEMLKINEFVISSNEKPHKPVVLISPEAQCCYARDSRGFASFAWSTLTRPVPNLNFVPLSDDSLAEWHEGNFLGALSFVEPVMWVGVKAMEPRSAGIKAEGTHLIRGLMSGSLGEHKLSVEQDFEKVRISTQFTAQKKIIAVHVVGLNWRVPNDVFNNFRRVYFFSGSDGSISSWESRVQPQASRLGHLSRWQQLKRKARRYGEVVRLGASRWLNVDNKIGIVFPSEQEFVVRRYPMKDAPWGSLNVEQVEAPRGRWLFGVGPGEALLSMQYVLHFGTAEETFRLASEA